MSIDDVRALSADLERALLRALMDEWRHVNVVAFGAKLIEPTIVLLEVRATLGRWVADRRTIEMSRSLVLEQTWGVVVEVLKHEMAHQWVHEGLGCRDESAHGPAFRDTCARLGIDSAATGLPSVRDEPERRVLDRIARLLALAESTNVHEAEAAMAAAQRLMLKHNLVYASARARGYAFRHVGRVTGRVTESERTLAVLLSKHFFVEAIWIPVYRPFEGKRASVLELCGTPANLDIAEWVHGFLTETAERVWREHKRSRAIGGDRDRRTFLAGVMAGFADKLSRQASVHAGEGLVWIGDRDLDGYLRRRHPRVRTVWSRGSRRDETFGDGRRAGAAIVLHKPVRAAATDGGRALLPAPRR